MSRNTYTGNGSTTDFTFTFGYLLRSHVKVTINGAATTAFTFFTNTTLRFNTAPANGASVVIYRDTPSSALLADFTSGSALRESDLELDLQQVLYVAQELKTYIDLQSTAGLQAQITTAQNAASSAVSTANTAISIAQGIAGTANNANSTASLANTTANAAYASAVDATNTANGISATASTALSTAQSAVTLASRAPVLTPEQETISGSSKNFTGIPTWASRITLILREVSTTNAGDILVQLGVGTTPTTTGYVNARTAAYIGGQAPVMTTATTSAIPIYNAGPPSSVTGRLVFEKLSSTLLEDWVCTGTLCTQNGVMMVTTGGISLFSAPEMLRISVGAGTFDLGRVNLIIE